MSTTSAGQDTTWQVHCTPQSAPTKMPSHAPTQSFSLGLTHVQWQDSAHSMLALECEGLRESVCTARTDTGVQLFHQGQAWAFDCPPMHRAVEQAAGSGALLAPLTARVLHVMVTPGQTVQVGERLLVLEAMKMEHTLTAPITGVVRELLAQAGGQALKGALLLQIEAEAA